MEYEMSLNLPTVVTFVVYLVAMLAIGLVAYKLTSNLSDYVLGGRRLGAGVAALSGFQSVESLWAWVDRVSPVGSVGPRLVLFGSLHLRRLKAP